MFSFILSSGKHSIYNAVLVGLSFLAFKCIHCYVLVREDETKKKKVQLVLAAEDEVSDGPLLLQEFVSMSHQSSA